VFTAGWRSKRILLHFGVRSIFRSKVGRPQSAPSKASPRAHRKDRFIRTYRRPRPFGLSIAPAQRHRLQQIIGAKSHNCGQNEMRSPSAPLDSVPHPDAVIPTLSRVGESVVRRRYHGRQLANHFPLTCEQIERIPSPKFALPHGTRPLVVRRSVPPKKAISCTHPSERVELGCLSFSIALQSGTSVDLLRPGAGGKPGNPLRLVPARAGS
jgi:hypothetical protein